MDSISEAYQDHENDYIVHGVLEQFAIATGTLRNDFSGGAFAEPQNDMF